VTSGCVSPDGIKVAVGTAHGSVGVLDVSSHAYDTLMRSHAKTIVAVASRPNKHLAFHGAYHTRVACFSMTCVLCSGAVATRCLLFHDLPALFWSCHTP
jgi:hypothetical protein